MIFTIVAHGRPILSYASSDSRQAGIFARSAGLRAELRAFGNMGKSVWNGDEAKLAFRQATLDEQTRCEFLRARAVRDGEILSNEMDWGVYLIESGSSAGEASKLKR